MGIIAKGAAALLGAAALAEAGGTAYFYRRTMMRYNAKTERTMKMSGVDWPKYMSFMQKRREWMMEQPHEDVWITSRDGLKLHGTYFKGDGGTKAVICFHGYTSKGLNDYGSLSWYYLNHGFRMLLIDERAHGESEGTYIGFGTMDRYDGLEWVKWMVKEIGGDAQIFLTGNSMVPSSGFPHDPDRRQTEQEKRRIRSGRRQCCQRSPEGYCADPVYPRFGRRFRSMLDV